MKKWLPLILTGVMAAWFLSTLRPPAQKDFDYEAFGKLPLVFNGRFQPMDSVARNSLLVIREKQSLYLPDEKRKMPAIEWLALVTMKPDAADQLKVFRIDHPDLISQLKLPQKGEAGSDGKHFSWAQIQPALDVMDRESKRIQERERKKESEPAQRTPFEAAVMKTHNRLVLYMRLKNTLQPQDARDIVQWMLSPHEPAQEAHASDLRTHGVGAQILMDLGVHKMRLMTAPKRIHGLAGFGLEVVDYVAGKE